MPHVDVMRHTQLSPVVHHCVSQTHARAWGTTDQEHNGVCDLVACTQSLEDEMAGKLRLDQLVDALVLAIRVLGGRGGVDGARADTGAARGPAGAGPSRRC